LGENTAPLLEASREVGIEVNAVKTKYMLIARHRMENKIIIYPLQINPMKIWGG